MSYNPEEIQIKIDTSIDNAATSKSLKELKKSIQELKGIAATIGPEAGEAFETATAAAAEFQDRIDDVNDALKNAKGEGIEGLKSGFGDLTTALGNLDFDKAGQAIDSMSNNFNKIDFNNISQNFDNFKLKVNDFASTIKAKIGEQSSTTMKGFGNVVGGVSKSLTSALGGDLRGAIAGVGTSFKGLGQIIKANPLLVLASVIILLIANFEKFKEVGGALGKVFQGVSVVIETVTDAFKSLTDAIGLTDFAAQKLANNEKNRSEARKKQIKDEIDLLNARNKADKGEQIQSKTIEEAQLNTKEIETKYKKYQDVIEEINKTTDMMKKSREKDPGLPFVDSLAKDVNLFEPAVRKARKLIDEFNKEFNKDLEKPKNYDDVRGTLDNLQANYTQQKIKEIEKVNVATIGGGVALTEAIKQQEEERVLNNKNKNAALIKNEVQRNIEVNKIEAEEAKKKIIKQKETNIALLAAAENSVKSTLPEVKRLAEERILLYTRAIRESDKEVELIDKELSFKNNKIIEEDNNRRNELAKAANEQKKALTKKQASDRLKDLKDEYTLLREQDDNFSKDQLEILENYRGILASFVKDNAKKLELSATEVRSYLANLNKESREDLSKLEEINAKKLRIANERRVVESKTLKEETDAKIKQAEDERDLLLKNEKLTADERIIITKNTYKQILDLTANFNSQVKQYEQERLDQLAASAITTASLSYKLRDAIGAINAAFTADLNALNASEKVDLERADFLGKSKEEIENEYRQRRENLEKQSDENILQAKLANINKYLAAATSLNQSLTGLSSAYNDYQQSLLKNGEKLTIKQQKGQFNREKALGITTAGINTAQGITGAFAQTATLGPVGSAILAGSIGAIGAAQIALIAAKKFNPDDSGSGSSASNTSIGNLVGSITDIGSKSSSISAPELFDIGNTSYNNDRSTLRVAVVESDIRNMTNKVNVLESASYFNGP